MADFADLAKRSAALREFDHTVGEVQFRLRLPTAYERRKIAVDHIRTDGAFDHVGIARAIVLGAVIGWSGVTTRALVPDADPDEPLDFSRPALEAFLDERLAVLDSLADEIEQRISARGEKVDAAKKP